MGTGVDSTELRSQIRRERKRLHHAMQPFLSVTGLILPRSDSARVPHQERHSDGVGGFRPDRLFQFEQLDVLVPDLVAVVLEAEKAFAGEVFDCSGFLVQFVLVLFAVGADSRFGEFVGVDFADF